MNVDNGRIPNVIIVASATDAGITMHPVRLHLYGEKHLLEFKAAIELELERRELERTEQSMGVPTKEQPS